MKKISSLPDKTKTKIDKTVELDEGWKETREIKADKEFYKEVKKGIASLRKGEKRVSFLDF